jgi:uncharacterized membrane protein
MKLLKAALILFFLTLTTFILPAHAADDRTPQEKKYDAVVTAIKEEKMLKEDNKNQLYQKLEVLITNGDKKGQKLTVENGAVANANTPKYQKGDEVVVTITQDPSGQGMAFISDYIRRTPIYVLFILFISLTLFISRKKGLFSLLGMAISFLVIFNFILPQILLGNNPILIAIFASAFFIPISFYLAHGLNNKTTAAIIGTLIALTITGILALVFVNWAKLTGYTEEIGYLQILKGITINAQGLLLSGIIISISGILNDVTVSQSAIVFQLKKTDQKLSFKDLYLKAMEVGKDHIASVVNTLVLVYTGSALALLLLFNDSAHPFTEIINYDFLAQAIIETLVSSIGLILAVPITTFIACMFAVKK